MSDFKSKYLAITPEQWVRFKTPSPETIQARRERAAHMATLDEGELEEFLAEEYENSDAAEEERQEARAEEDYQPYERELYEEEHPWD